MKPALLFDHGWAFDSRIWRAVGERLSGFRCLYADRGYFRDAREPVAEAPYCHVGHSMGALRGMASASGECLGLVAINGFDCFMARDGFPGVAPRVLDRMIANFETRPGEVVSQFRQRCGAGEPEESLDVTRLGADLLALRNADCRGARDLPILSLQGGEDPILPPAMRAALFAGAGRVEREEREGAGHLLPLTDPDYCAAMIADFAEQLG